MLVAADITASQLHVADPTYKFGGGCETRPGIFCKLLLRDHGSPEWTILARAETTGTAASLESIIQHVEAETM